MYGNHTQKTLSAWLAAAVLAAAATCTPELWSLDIARVQQGEWWRVACGHLVHLTWQHYLYDLLALGLTLCLCCRLAAGFNGILFTALCSAGSVSLALLVLQPVEIYGGLSGITAGLLAWAALKMLRHDAPAAGAALIAGMLIKLCLEQHGSSVSGVVAVWQAHGAGALAGVLTSCFYDQQDTTNPIAAEARSMS